jgi:hypothetical protein
MSHPGIPSDRMASIRQVGIGMFRKSQQRAEYSD